MTELETKLLGALKEMTSIVEIHIEATNNNFAWAELDAAHEAIAAAEAAQPDEVRSAVDAEREACVRVCENISAPSNLDDPLGSWVIGTLDCASAIRARGNKH